ncbi:radical SAM protein [Stigmatella sp. ncwal1]|uniref:Radical SAM protein n=1 Tax=Stigmatella ashevillensis TaxID=2995309 RepID=A0ABT5DB21_9BACT|nr:radical SAM protein [Stigmatella ashevillena]MDC0710013.1 radical SAM protein [Stigmatella ashevillena]
MQVETIVWDMTYACSLRCIHCYSESGRRPAGARREEVLRIAEEIARVKPRDVALSGGEPFLAPGWEEAVQCLHSAGIAVSVYVSGWLMDEALAERLAGTMTRVCVSVDGARASTHDAIRGREGSFERAMVALELLAHQKRERLARGEPCYSLEVEMTVMRSNLAETELLVQELSRRFPGLDGLRLGMAIPGGLAADEDFEERELLTDAESLALLASKPRLAALASSGVRVAVTDVRPLFAQREPGAPRLPMAHLEPDGQLRAFETCEAKVGNVLEEPFEVLWERALAWRGEAFVVEQFGAIRSLRDWARASRALDQRFGSAEDLARIARRPRRTLSSGPPGSGYSR